MDIKRRGIEPIWLTVLKNYNFVALETRAFETMMPAVAQMTSARRSDARGSARDQAPPDTSKRAVRYNERMIQTPSTYPEFNGHTYNGIAMQTSAQASNPYERMRLQALEPYADFVDTPQPGVVAVVGSSVETLANPSLRTALTASVERFGYTLADIAWISRETHGTHDGAQGDMQGENTADTLDDKALLTVIEALDPIALIICDEDSARACAHAYRTSINLDCATALLIRPCACFTNLVFLLDTQSGKQRAWHILKETLGAL